MRIPTSISRLFRSLIWNVPQSKNTVYLTFDDGPIPDVTPWVLDLLQEKNIKATFFCIGDNIQKHPEIFKRIVKDGHRIGNHSFNHLNGWSHSANAYIENVEACEREIAKYHKPERKLFRPPYGKITPRKIKALKQRGYEVVMWEILSKDYDKHLAKEQCYANATKKVRSGSIIVFHDSLKAQENLRYALPKTLDTLLEKGYVFGTL